MKYVLTVSYDGTRYFGWQQTRSGPSIQECLGGAIEQIAKEKVVPEAASRTDRGVHAEGQVVAFSLDKEWEPRRLQKALNAALPQDIRVVKIEEALPAFHPTLDTRQKEYHYRLCIGAVQEPHWRAFSWHFRRPLNVVAMEEASLSLIGTNDFQAFANEREENPLCTLSEIAFVPLERQRLQISLTGDRFLYKMARNLVGTLLYIGCGKLPPDCLPALLQSRDRKQAGMTAPAHGLFLHRVDY